MGPQHGYSGAGRLRRRRQVRPGDLPAVHRAVGDPEVQYELHEQLHRLVGPQHGRAGQQEAVAGRK